MDLLSDIASAVSQQNRPGQQQHQQQQQPRPSLPNNAPSRVSPVPPPGASTNNNQNPLTAAAVGSRRFSIPSNPGAVASALRKRKSLPPQAILIPSAVQPSTLAAAAAGLPRVAAVANAPGAAKRQKKTTDTNKKNTDGTGFKTEHSVRFREYQAEIWSEKFEELCTFRRFYGHCHVPHTYEANAPLAQWVKRQRYQYKLRQDGKRSTLSDERVRLLNDLGFIWNSHDAVWEERLNELLLFKKIYGHCIVPSSYDPNPQLAVWVKRQRRQYKFLQEGKATSMTPERISKLEAHGFAWDCRKNKEEQSGREPVSSFTGVSAKSLPTSASLNGEVEEEKAPPVAQINTRQEAELAVGTGGVASMETNVSLANDVASKPNNQFNTKANNPTNSNKAALKVPRCEFLSFGSWKFGIKKTPPANAAKKKIPLRAEV